MRRATEVERFAAEELQHYVREMTRVGGEGTARRSRSSLPMHPANGCDIVIGRRRPTRPLPPCASNNTCVSTPRRWARTATSSKPCAARAARATLLLTGLDRAVPLFAVYHFLETCGARFFGYRDRDGQIVPHAAMLRMPPLDIVEKPAFRYRFVSDNDFSAADKTRLVNVADWAAEESLQRLHADPLASWRIVGPGSGAGRSARSEA